MLRFSKNCSYCGTKMDSFAEKCPNCEEKNPDPVIEKEKMAAVYPWWKQILFFVTGWLFFNIVAYPIAFLLGALGYGSGAFINYTVYLVTFTAMIFVIWNDFHPLFKSFKSWKPYVFGIAGYILLLILENGWGIISTIIFSLLNIAKSTNANEAAVQQVVQTYPFMSLIIFGIIGPICEELTYRVGLFSLTRRVNIVLAYFVSIGVFALIHFDQKSVINIILDPSQDNLVDLIVELLNLPAYLMAGAVFTFLYHKWGFAASLTAHVTNNSIINILAIISKLINSIIQNA